MCLCDRAGVHRRQGRLAVRDRVPAELHLNEKTLITQLSKISQRRLKPALAPRLVVLINSRSDDRRPGSVPADLPDRLTQGTRRLLHSLEGARTDRDESSRSSLSALKRCGKSVPKLNQGSHVRTEPRNQRVPLKTRGLRGVTWTMRSDCQPIL